MFALIRRHVHLEEQRQSDDRIRVLADDLIAESLTTSNESNAQRELMEINQQALVLFIIMILLGYFYVKALTRGDERRAAA